MPAQHRAARQGGCGEVGLGWAGLGGPGRGGAGLGLRCAALRCAGAGAEAGAGARSERCPNPNQVRDFLYFLASYRRRRSLESGLKMKGQSQASMTTYVSHLAAHLLPGSEPIRLFRLRTD